MKYHMKDKVIMTNPILLDTTLRDGEQTPGLYFTNPEKIEIVQSLDHLNIPIIEVGVPSMGIEEQKLIRQLVAMNFKAELITWNRLNINDLFAALKTGTTHAHFSVPLSTEMLSLKLKKDITWVQRQMESVISLAKKEGMTVSFGAEDASRTDIKTLLVIFDHAINLGVSRIRYADTLGTLVPDKTYKILKTLCSTFKIPIDFHAHNDFGLATANSICAWKAGANTISCSLLGLGERAGNTALEELIGIFYFLENKFQSFNLKDLKIICKKVSAYSQKCILPTKPIFGNGIFTHESGIHVDGLIKSPKTYELFSPELLEEKRNFVIGKHSGTSSLKYAANHRGYQLSTEQSAKFMSILRQKMSYRKGINAAQEFTEYLKKINP